MSIEIREMLIHPSKYSLKSPYEMQPEYITVHNTANDASALNEIKYMTNNVLSTSFHFAVDDKEIIQALPLNRNGFHCTDGAKGTGNRKSIGIEICFSKSGGEKYVQAEEKAVKLIAHLLLKFGWGIDRVKQHNHWYKKNCPHRIRDEGRWDSFLQRIEAAMQSGKVDAPQVKPEVIEQPQPIQQPQPQPQPIQQPSNLIRNGSRGEEVKRIQAALGIAADGIFGPKTEAAVRSFQSRNGLVSDGIVGPKTAEKLFAPKKETPKKSVVPYPGTLIKKGSKGANVKKVQAAIGVAADGIFGPKTEAAVKSYQKRNGLAADGIVGQQTWNKLFN